MKKGIVLGIVFLFVMMSFTSISGIQIDKNIIVPSGRGNILYVGGSGPGNYSTIQSAIDDAVDGDTVFVYNGTYYEHPRIYKTILLIGEDNQGTIISSPNWADSVRIFSDGVTIKRVNIDGGNYYHDDKGIYSNGNNTTIVDCLISGDANSITLSKSSNNFVSNNYCSSYVSGHYITDSNFVNNIAGGLPLLWSSNCNASGNHVRTGIALDGSSNMTIVNNVLIESSLYGITLEPAHYCYIYNNSISNTEYSGISLGSTSHDNIIIANNISHIGYYGIGLSVKTKDNVILNNKIKKCDSGININGKNNFVSYNTITESRCGISFTNGSNNNIFFNKVKDCSFGIRYIPQWAGYYEYFVFNNNYIFNNSISDNGRGIYLTHEYGSRFQDNFFYNNDIICNIIGIEIHNTYTYEGGYVRDNHIYSNNFIENEDYNALLSGNKLSINIWDDGKYGNYWSDYKERYPFAMKSLSKPWMWNIPYRIPGGSNKDRCPLVNQWPDLKPRTITRNTPTNSPNWLRFLDMFPILERLLDMLMV